METSDKIHSGTGKNENSKEKAETEHNVHFTMCNVSYELLFIYYLLSARTVQGLQNFNKIKLFIYLG